MAEIPPSESDLLCEECGYILYGLPDTGNCPECGKPIVPSTTANQRKPPEWEENANLENWLATSVRVILAPARFFRGYDSRGNAAHSQLFAGPHWWIASICFFAAFAVHFQMVIGFRVHNGTEGIGVVVTILLFWLAVRGITELACRLTTWEAAYRGLRLPLPVVRRAMHYHAAHISLVALLTAFTVLIFCWLFDSRILPYVYLPIYLYTLCGEVIVFAGYLFFTYWAAMRNIMFANR